eukprot:scaffold5510_cov76-Amphora_coffeaeformis.AAC.3
MLVHDHHERKNRSETRAGRLDATSQGLLLDDGIFVCQGQEQAVDTQETIKALAAGRNTLIGEKDYKCIYHFGQYIQYHGRLELQCFPFGWWRAQSKVCPSDQRQGSLKSGLQKSKAEKTTQTCFQRRLVEHCAAERPYR